jgi:hypothetical protein
VEFNVCEEMSPSLHRSRSAATKCTADVSGSGRALVLPVTWEIIASWGAATVPSQRFARERSLNEETIR